MSSEENQKYIKAQEIARCCEKQFRININFKNISKIINPLYNQGLIEIADGSKKNSAKNVRLSDKIINNKVYLNLIREIEYFCEPKYSFKEAYDIIINKKVKADGIALECIGLYIAKILGLTNIKYRECSEVTGHCEVDISGEDRNFTYQRWHIQCKDNKSVTNDRIAREVGIAQISKVNNILFITTGKFSDYATLYCEKVMKETNVNIYYIETKELKEIRDNPEKLIEIIREQSDRISRLRNRTTMLV